MILTDNTSFMYDFQTLKQWKSIVKGSADHQDGVKVVPAHSSFEGAVNCSQDTSREASNKVDLATLVDLLAVAGEQNQCSSKNMA